MIHLEVVRPNGTILIDMLLQEWNPYLLYVDPKDNYLHMGPFPGTVIVPPWKIKIYTIEDAM